MGTLVETFIANWRDAAEGKDPEKIFTLLSNEMTFYSPVLFKPSTDRAYIDAILRFVDETLSDFEYIEIYEQPQGAAMIFRAKVGDLTVEGVDFFKLDDEGKVIKFGFEEPGAARPEWYLQASIRSIISRLNNPIIKNHFALLFKPEK